MPKLNWKGVVAEADAEYRRCHGNANLSGKLPKVNDEEWDIFWHSVDAELYSFLRQVESEIYKRFGVAWRLGAYNPDATTIAPAEFACHSAPASGLAEICLLYCCWSHSCGPYAEALADYNRDYKVLRALRYLNQQVRAWVEQDWQAWWDSQWAD